MSTYLIRRSLHTIVALILMILVVFVFSHSIGDPARLMLPDDASPEAISTLKGRLGLNDPWYVQLSGYLVGLARFDLGTSLWQKVPNAQLILGRLPATLLLATTAITVATLVGVILGGLAALRPRSVVDRFVTVLSTVAVTSVDFWIALMLISLISVDLGWLPTSGYGDIKHLILPALVVSFRPIGRIAQVTRPALAEELDKQYIVVARAKGLSERFVLWIHAARNAGIVIATLVGYEFAALVEGSVIIETVFGWPGVGYLLVQAIGLRDWTLIVATTLVIAGLVILMNWLVDLVYLALDPRIKYQ